MAIDPDRDAAAAPSAVLTNYRKLSRSSLLQKADLADSAAAVDTITQAWFARSTVRENGASFSKERCVRGAIIIIFHLRQQQVAEVAFAAHENVVEAFRTDQSFDIPALPWRPWRRRLIANAH